MPAQRLVISPAAKTDLKNIYQYGLRKWGQKQSDNYPEIIKKHFWSLMEQPLNGIDRSEMLLGTRSLPIESHTLFYRVSRNAVEIIRVLHSRQDPQRHLK